MNKKITTSKKYTVNKRDLLVGLLMATGSALCTYILDMLSYESFEFNYRKIAIVGISAGITYLLKNFFTESHIITKPVTDKEIDIIDKANEENGTLGYDVDKFMEEHIDNKYNPDATGGLSEVYHHLELFVEDIKEKFILIKIKNK